VEGGLPGPGERDQMNDIEARIIENRNIILNYFLLKLKLSETMGTIKPGQFAMLKVPHKDVFLRRPFSIYDYGKETITIVYRVVGKGTQALSQAGKSEKTRVLGPLGNGFTIKERDAYIVIAGGIGIAGVHLLIKHLKDKTRLFYGCSTQDELCVIDDVRHFNPAIATLDGTMGFKGNVVEMFRKEKENYFDKNAEIFACGPEDMIKGIRKEIGNAKTPCQVLVEERMACGLGLCFGCVIKTSDENEPYKRACKEGRFLIYGRSLSKAV
jgi:dihydroorotate dehydrogenase electron transfer subunit